MGLESVILRSYDNGYPEPILYWKSHSKLHAWFVEHVQNGKDDGEVWRVSQFHILMLRLYLLTLAAKDWEDRPAIARVLKQVYEDWDEAAYYWYQGTC